LLSPVEPLAYTVTEAIEVSRLSRATINRM